VKRLDGLLDGQPTRRRRRWRRRHPLLDRLNPHLDGDEPP
jgi:hypothetical protein